MAVAAHTMGSVAIIDRLPVGVGVTSACATPMPVISEFSAEESIQQIFTEAIVHLPHSELIFKLNPPFASFDYHDFCGLLAARSRFELIKATVTGYDPGVVHTDKGDVAAPIVVDCTGWRAVLASSIEPGFAQKRRISFGYETNAQQKDSRMHFFFNPSQLGRGYGWLFPCGEEGARLGVCTYRPGGRVDDEFKWLAGQYGVERRDLHGGFFPHRLRKGVVGDLFLAGDSAGMCFATTGEGIRQALYFGSILGDLLEDARTGGISLDEARVAYGMAIEDCEGYYQRMLNVQRMLMFMPSWSAGPVARILQRRFTKVLNEYLAVTGHTRRT